MLMENSASDSRYETIHHLPFQVDRFAVFADRCSDRECVQDGGDDDEEHGSRIKPPRTDPGMNTQASWLN